MRKPPKLPPIRFARERVDDATDAVLAWCFRVVKRRIYDPASRKTLTRPFLTGLSIFVLAPHERWGWQHAAEEAINAEIERRGRRLPNIDWCENIPGWADYEVAR